MRRGALLGVTVVFVLLVGSVALASDGTLVDHHPIVIGSNYEFTSDNGVVSGSGTSDDPYIIEGWKIDAGYHKYGISIHRTDRYVVIRNVQVSGASQSAILLSYVENATIAYCTLSGNWIGVTLNFASANMIRECKIANNTDGVHLYFAHDNQIFQNVVSKNDTGIWFDASNTNEIIRNEISSNHMGVYLDLGAQGNLVYHNAFIDNYHNAHSVDVNQWDKDGEGNYWSDWKAIDADGNGIWDSPYVIRSQGDQDNFPLVTPPNLQTSRSK